MEFTFVKNAQAYRAENGEVIQREYGNTPHMNALNGHWVYRNQWGKFVDYAQFRTDLAERYEINLVGDMDE